MKFSAACAKRGQRGATEVCMQGGIHPDYTGQTYLDIVAAVKAAVPEMHVHAFSPLEVWQGAKTLGIDLETFLQKIERRGAWHLAGHGGGNSRRRSARDYLPRQN